MTELIFQTPTTGKVVLVPYYEGERMAGEEAKDALLEASTFWVNDPNNLLSSIKIKGYGFFEVAIPGKTIEIQVDPIAPAWLDRQWDKVGTNSWRREITEGLYQRVFRWDGATFKVQVGTLDGSGGWEPLVTSDPIISENLLVEVSEQRRPWVIKWQAKKLWQEGDHKSIFEGFALAEAE